MKMYFILLLMSICLYSCCRKTTMSTMGESNTVEKIIVKRVNDFPAHFVATIPVEPGNFDKVWCDRYIQTTITSKEDISHCLDMLIYNTYACKEITYPITLDPRVKIEIYYNNGYITFIFMNVGFYVKNKTLYSTTDSLISYIVNLPDDEETYRINASKLLDSARRIKQRKASQERNE